MLGRRARRVFLERVDPERRESLRRSLEAGGFEPPTVTSFTMTGASSLYGAGETPHEPQSPDQSVGAIPAVTATKVGSFDRLTHALATTSSRRQALKVFGTAAAGAVAAAVLKPFGVAAAASCPSGTQHCGSSRCCPRGTFCSQIGTSKSCCCRAGATPCGPGCCDAGVACIDSTRGLCGCAAGKTVCRQGPGLYCCPAGRACPGVNSTTCAKPVSHVCIPANVVPI
ncbi:MAG TPA: hypothetical protein VNY84_15585 [Acidimicrobiales bacterium]|nr:hypothetical protein [Acidimicrobiales bacterium]